MSELQAVLARVLKVWSDPQVWGSALTLMAVGLLALRLRGGPGAWRGLLGRRVRTDLVYTTFYVGGFYAFFVSTPIYRLLVRLVEAHAPSLRLDLLAGLPPLLQLLVSSVVLDGVLYFTHRALHAHPWLWAFHAVHHSQEELTAFTNFRFHALDALLRGLAQFVPALVLGVPSQVFLLTVWLQVALDGLAHSGLGWSYGPLGAVLVSPRFHRLHHSRDPAHHDRNFGLTYSFWDRLFGTRVEGTPAAYGLAGPPVPDTFLRQLAFPFLFLARTVGSARRTGARSAPAPSSP